MTFAAAMAWMRRPLASVGGFGHGLARSAHGRLLCDTAMEGLRATLRRPFGVENLWMTTMCGWRLVFASGTICKGRSYSVIPTFSRCRAATAAMSAAVGLTGTAKWCVCVLVLACFQR